MHVHPQSQQQHTRGRVHRPPLRRRQQTQHQPRHQQQHRRWMMDGRRPQCSGGGAASTAQWPSLPLQQPHRPRQCATTSASSTGLATGSASAGSATQRAAAATPATRWRAPAGSTVSKAGAAAAAARPTAAASLRTRRLSCPPPGGRPPRRARTSTPGSLWISLQMAAGMMASPACCRRQACRWWPGRPPWHRSAALACAAWPQHSSRAGQQQGGRLSRRRGYCPHPALDACQAMPCRLAASCAAGARPLQHPQQKQRLVQQQRRHLHGRGHPASAGAPPGRLLRSRQPQPLHQQRQQQQLPIRMRMSWLACWT